MAEPMRRSILAPVSLRSRRALSVAGAALLLAVLMLQMALSVRQESLSWDEGDHIFAGYMSWKHADFGLNPEHPPLVKLVATVPLLSMPLKVPKVQDRYFKSEAYFDGRDLIYGNDAGKIVFRARMAAMIFSVLLALIAFLAAREMFGAGAAFIALTLVVFEPNLLAHGAMVTTDTGLACFLLATIYAFYRYVKAPSILRLAVTGLAAGLAAATKHSAILLLPMLALLALTEVLRRRNRAGRDSAVLEETRGRQALRLAVAIVAVAAIAAAILWGVYGFRYAARPNGQQINPPLAEAVRGLKPVEAQGILTLARWRLLPESYLYGLADVRGVANFMPSYIFGRVYEHGVWFYFPAAFVIKATLALLLLLSLAVLAIALRRLNRWREVLFVTIPPLVYMLVSMGSHLNIGARHILLVFIFASILAAGAAWSFIRADRRWIYPLGAVLLFHVVSSVRAFPTSYMAYSNELWGGPPATYKYLTDSNTDWGQQLIGTKKYLDARGVKSCWFAYFVDPAIRPSAYGIPCRSLPTPDTTWFGEQIDTPPTIEGPVLISAGDLSGYELGSNVLNPYRSFQRLRPTAVIEHGVFVFDGTFNVPLASALGHVRRSRALLARQELDQALAEARTAAALAPDAMQPQMTLGAVLTAMHRTAEARPAYQKALAIAATMEPGARESWSSAIRRNLDAR
jgi:Dolichyl-phosphate-mannose-protein mannosyltransferase